MNKYIIFFILVILIIYYYYKAIKSNNTSRHLYDNNKYAHFSKITSNNIIMYPLYIYTNPQKYTLNAGDALIIPKKWWHWVFSSDNTLAINYWNNDNNDLFYSPKILKNFIEPFDIKSTKIDNFLFKFNILDGINDKLYNANIKDLINNNNNNQYLLTLDAFTNNDHIKSYLNDKIKHPKYIIDNNLNRNYNFWYSPKKMDTGLHYDDENGVLCVLSGQKYVILYPPSDSKYLYPYDIKPKWYYNKFENIEYNIYKLNIPKFLNKIPSNNILYKAFTNKKKLMTTIVDDLYEYSKKTSTIIYGIKNDKKEIWFEYYFYNVDKYRKTSYSKLNFDIIKTLKYLKNLEYLNDLSNINLYELSKFIKNKNLIIFSFEVHDIGIINDIDLYINNNNNNILPFYGTTYNMKNSIISKKNIFIVDNYKNFIENIDYYCNYFNLLNLKDEILKEYNKYNYVDIITFYKKSKNIIALQWFGLTNKDMINFLKDNNWNNITEFYEKNNLKHMNNEITINYEIKDNKLYNIRTSIYGSI